jgi:hypothetical protein
MLYQLRTLFVFLGAAAGLALIAPAEGARKPVAVRLPDLIPVEAALANRFVSQEGGRRLLRFDSRIANIGEGPAEVRGSSKRRGMLATQALYPTTGKRIEQVSIGQFEYHQEHFHWHLLQVAEYRLLSLDGTVLSRSDKISFCLMDSVQHAALPGSPSAQHYLTCTTDPRAKSLVTGISVGWADNYPAHLADQWVDVTGIPAGDYLLQVVINPDGIIRETTRANNTATVPVTLP